MEWRQSLSGSAGSAAERERVGIHGLMEPEGTNNTT